MISRHCLKWFWYSERVLDLKLSISSRHCGYSVKAEKPSQPVGTIQICFWYFFSFNMKSFFLTDQTEVAPNMKVFFKHHKVEIHIPLTNITNASLISIATFQVQSKSTLLTICHCCAYVSILLDQNFRDGQTFSEGGRLKCHIDFILF